MSQDNQIREGMTRGEILDRGGYVGADNRVYDKSGAAVSTMSGNLTMQHGEARPEKR